VSATDVERLVAASSLAELCWLDASGVPCVRGVVPLVRDGRPALAFLYADEAVARSVAAAGDGQVALVLAENRSTSPAFTPTVLRGRPRLVEDPSGDIYLADLVVQELRRYPPSRLFADSPLLMRENWWWLPRLVVEVDVEAAEPATARPSPYDLVLAAASDDRVTVRAAGLLDPSGDRLVLELDGAPPAPGPAVLFGQDASFPDLETWSQWQWRGHWDGTLFRVDQAPARVGLGRTPGLIQRWRRQRDLERRCRAAIPPG
jgi:hypothetical protein